MITNTSFGHWLKQRRKALDLTQEDLARRIGCAAVTIYKIEANERRPSKQIAFLLADYLNIPAGEHDVFIRFARNGTFDPTAAVDWGIPLHRPANLSTELTPLIGRDTEIAALHKRLLQDEIRLMTLIGPPGIGKTRLALRLVTEVWNDFADGVFFVPLASISDPLLVPPTIMATLALEEIGPQTPLERLKTYLRGKQMLLVLDNFEQILAAAPSIAELLSTCPLLKMLVTSRAPLRIRPERQFPVTPLALPNLAALPDVETLSDYAAVTLFLERAQAVKPDFSLTLENAPTVAAICTRLDGLPLAIELISARVKLLPPTALLERLSGRLLLQSDGLRDIEPRHRTLNNAIDWSYQLLNTEEQTLFRRLGVFVGGWTLEAAEAVCLNGLSLNPLDALASLLDKNLIKQAAGVYDEPRFTILETIREYALQQLVASGELEALCLRQLAYFLDLAEQADAHEYGGAQTIWYDRLDADLENVRAALAWSERTRQVEKGLRIVGALGWFWDNRAHWLDGLDWLARLLALDAGNVTPAIRAKALNRIGDWSVSFGDARSADFLNEALTLARSTNDEWNIAWALAGLARLSGLGGMNQSALLYDESLALFRKLGDALGLSHLLRRRASMAITVKDYTYARLLLEESLVRARAAGAKNAIAWTLLILTDITLDEDHDLEQARAQLEECLSLFRELRDVAVTSMILAQLAAIEHVQGNTRRSESLYEEALRLKWKNGIYSGTGAAQCLMGLGNLAARQGRLERSTRLLAAASIHRNAGMAFANFDQTMESLRLQLGEGAFGVAWSEGKSMIREQAIAYALQDIAPLSNDVVAPSEGRPRLA